MRILMMGTGPFAVPTFQWLLESAHDVPALITRPHRSQGRRKPPPNPMRDAAEAAQLPVHAPDSINSDQAQALLREIAADLFVVCDYGQILSRNTLALATRGGINLHSSLLPKYRGAAPIHWAVYHGETETGVSVIHMTPRLDGGPVIAVRSTPIDPEETADTLETRLSQLGVDAVNQAIQRIADSQPDETIGQLQDASQSTKAPRLSKEDGVIDWTRTARQIKNQVRAFQPWPGSYTYLTREGQQPLRLILSAVSVVPADDCGTGLPLPGRVALVEKNRLLVATGKGLLSLDRVQPAGKTVMEIGQWLRGHKVTTEDLFQPLD